MKHIGITMLLILCACGIAGAIWLRSSTRYDLGDDRLVIGRGGRVVMEIKFDDIEEILVQRGFLTQFRQISFYQLPPRKIMRIQKRTGFRYGLITPKEPLRIIDAVNAYRSAHPVEPTGMIDPSPGLSYPSKPPGDETVG